MGGDTHLGVRRAHADDVADTSAAFLCRSHSACERHFPNALNMTGAVVVVLAIVEEYLLVGGHKRAAAVVNHVLRPTRCLGETMFAEGVVRCLVIAIALACSEEPNPRQEGFHRGLRQGLGRGRTEHRQIGDRGNEVVDNRVVDNLLVGARHIVARHIVGGVQSERHISPTLYEVEIVERTQTSSLCFSTLSGSIRQVGVQRGVCHVLNEHVRPIDPLVEHFP